VLHLFFNSKHAPEGLPWAGIHSTSSRDSVHSLLVEMLILVESVRWISRTLAFLASFHEPEKLLVRGNLTVLPLLAVPFSCPSFMLAFYMSFLLFFPWDHSFQSLSLLVRSFCLKFAAFRGVFAVLIHCVITSFYYFTLFIALSLVFCRSFQFFVLFSFFTFSLEIAVPLEPSILSLSLPISLLFSLTLLFSVRFLFRFKLFS
jgi:hypothetical protein